jgi:hypothetical protein
MRTTTWWYATVILAAATAACGSPPTSSAEPEPLKPKLSETLLFFELTGECTQAAGAPPWHQYKQYAQYEVMWAGWGPFASTDSFRIYEGGGSDPWGSAGVIVQGSATAGSAWLGDWDYDTYLVQGTDYRFFWLQFFNSSGPLTDPALIAGDSVLVSAGCEA